MDFKKTNFLFDCIDMKTLFNNISEDTKCKIIEAIKKDIQNKLPDKYIPNDKKIEEKLLKQNSFQIDMEKDFLTPYNFTKLIFISNAQTFALRKDYLKKLILSEKLDISDNILDKSKIKLDINLMNITLNNGKIIKSRNTILEKLTFLMNEKGYVDNLKEEINKSLIVSVDFEKIFGKAHKSSTLKLINTTGLNENKKFMEDFSEFSKDKKNIEIPAEFAYYIYDNNSKKRYMEHTVFSSIIKQRHRDNVPTFMCLSTIESNIDKYLNSVALKFKHLNKPLIFVGLGISNDLNLLSSYLKQHNVQYKVIDLKDLIQTIHSDEDNTLAISNLLTMYLKTTNGSFVEYNNVHNPLNDCVIGVNVFNNLVFGEQSKSILNDKRLGLEYINLYEEFSKLSEYIDNKEFLAKIKIDTFAEEIEKSIITYMNNNKPNIDKDLINPIITYCIYKNFYKNDNKILNRVNIKDSFNFLNDVISHLKDNYKELNEQDIKGIKNYLKYDISEQAIYYPKHI